MSVDLCLSSTVVSDDTFHNMFPLVIVFFSAGIGPLARQVTDWMSTLHIIILILSAISLNGIG